MRQVNSNLGSAAGLMGFPGEDSGQPGCSETAEEQLLLELGGEMLPCSCFWVLGLEGAPRLRMLSAR